MISFNTISLIRMGHLDIPVYRTIMLIVIWIIPLVFVWKARKKNIPKIHILNLFLIFLLGGPLGARFLYVLFNPTSLNLQKSFSKILIEIFTFWNGGLISYGAIIFPFLFLIIYTCKNKNLRWKKIWDIVAPFIPLAFAVQRVGCFLHGCCFGKPTNLPWGIVYDQTAPAFGIFSNTPIHPTQAYLLIGNLIIFLILLKLEKIKDNTESINFDGSIFFIFLVLYSTMRFFIDFIRYYKPYCYIEFLTKGQIICVLMFVWAAYHLIKWMKEKSLQSS